MNFPFVHAADVDEAHQLAGLGPTFIAVEPPELIGGEISVTTADPAIVSETVDAVRGINPNVRVLCGAGERRQRCSYGCSIGCPWRLARIRCHKSRGY